MDFPFQLKAWHAVAPRLHVREDWQRWAEHPEILTTLPERAPDLAHVPALQRRRLSPAARLMFAAVHPPLVAHGKAPLVFVSHDGEMRRSFDLWRDLLVEGAVSPMSFGLSAIRQSIRHFVHAMQGWKRRSSRLARCSLKVRSRCWW